MENRQTAREGSLGQARQRQISAWLFFFLLLLLLTSMPPPPPLLELFEWVLDHRRRLDLNRRRGCGDRRVHPVIVVMIILVANINICLPTLIIKSLRQATLPNLKRSPQSLPECADVGMQAIHERN